MKKIILFAIVCLALAAGATTTFAATQVSNNAPQTVEIASNNPSALSPVAAASTTTDSTAVTVAPDMRAAFRTMVQDVVMRLAINAKMLERKFRHVFALPNS